MNSLFSLDFWFNIQPVGLTPLFSKVFFVLFASFIVFGAIANIVAKNRKDDRLLVSAYRRIAQLFYVMGWVGFFFWFASYETLYIFGARFWYLLWVLGVLFWAWRIYVFIAKVIPQQREELQHRADVNKYLPRRVR